MSKIAEVAVVLAIALGAANVSAQPSRLGSATLVLVGDWTGQLPGQRDAHIVVHVRPADAGVAATYDKVDQGVHDVPLSDFKQEGSKVSFTISGTASRYEGKVNAAGRELNGMLQQGGVPVGPLALSRSAPGANTAEPVREIEETASDGVRLHVLQGGRTGTWVVLLHGVTGSARSNYLDTGIVADLAARHRVLALDFRGQGQSEKPLSPDRYGNSRLAQDVIEVMDRAGVQKAHIVGYSLGGQVEELLLSTAPSRFLTATFGGAGIREEDPARERTLARLDRAGSDPNPPPGAERLWASPAKDDPVMKAMMGAPPPPARLLDLTAIRFPVLSILGEFNEPTRWSSRMKRELPDYRLVVLPGRTHLTALADPAFRTTLVAFVDGHDG